MKELISKELIENVLNCEIKDFKMFGCDLMYYEKALFRVNCQGQASKDRDSICRAINIYELDFICREWAYTKGFIVEIGVHPIIKQNRNDRDYFYAIKTLNGELLKKSNVDEIMKSEPTATLKACNWILEQNK